MGNWAAAAPNKQRSSKKVVVRLTILHHDGQVDIVLDDTITIGQLKTRWRYCDHNGNLLMDPQGVFSFTTGLGSKDIKYIIHEQVAADHLKLGDVITVSDIDDKNQPHLDIQMLHKQHGNWIRYQCTDCGYSGSLEYYNGMISDSHHCDLCKKRLPSPHDVISDYQQHASPPLAKNTLQLLLKQSNNICSVISVLNAMKIPIQITQCVVGCLIGDIRSFDKDDGFVFAEREYSFHYALIYNPFKPFLYEWIPLKLQKYNPKTQTIVLCNTFREDSQPTMIRTDFNHSYLTLVNGKSFADAESEKECKLYIACRSTKIGHRQRFNVSNFATLDGSNGIVDFTIKTLTGKSIMARMSLHDHVWQLKQYVCNQEGIPVEQQRFISPFGRDMADWNTLRYYGIAQGSPVRLVLRLRGC